MGPRSLELAGTRSILRMAPGGQAKLMTFLHDALRNSKGDSSKAFDDAMGLAAERLEEPWLKWLEQKVGIKRRRKS